jgi:hypothetical protein
MHTGPRRSDEKCQIARRAQGSPEKVIAAKGVNRNGSKMTSTDISPSVYIAILLTHLGILSRPTRRFREEHVSIYFKFASSPRGKADD